MAAVIANEQLDYSIREMMLEGNGVGSSVGAAQITVATTTREELWTERELEMMNNAADPVVGLSLDDVKRRALMNTRINIGIAGRLMSHYLDKICADAKAGAISSSFLNDVAPGCNIVDFCCKTDRRCDRVVSLDVPDCLIRSMAAMWNNGPKVVTVNDIISNSPNAYYHALWASMLDDMLSPTSPFNPGRMVD